MQIARLMCHPVPGRAPVLPLACLLAAGSARADVTPTFYALGHLPGTTVNDISTAQGVSANGVVVGYGFTPSPAFTPEAFRWTAAAGMTVLPLPSGASGAYAMAVSADGSVIAGYCETPGGNRAAVWDASGPRLAPLPAGATGTELTACSADGLSLTGFSIMPGNVLRATVWPATGSVTVLGLLSGTSPSSIGYGMSGDGTTAAGYSGSHAFGWTATAGMFDLGDLVGGNHGSIAYAVSADGSVIVGDTSKVVGGREAFRWTQAGGMLGLGAFPLTTGPTFSYARGVSADGQIVAGFSTTPDFQEAFLWTADTGLRNVLNTLTMDYGVDVSGWLLAYGYALSPDGTMIVGQGLHLGHTEAWAAILPRPCYANCDHSTGSPVLNVNDFVCFVNRFAAGDSYANCDHSTAPPVLNVNDFVCFQARFVAGCP